MGMISTHGFKRGLHNVHERNAVLERQLTSLQTEHSALKKEVNATEGLRDRVIELQQKLGCAAAAFGTRVCGICFVGNATNPTGPEGDEAGVLCPVPLHCPFVYSLSPAFLDRNI